MYVILDDTFIKKNKTLFNHRKCIFLVGAGISVASGIPDFRSETGIFAKLRENLKIDGSLLFSYGFGLQQTTRGIYLDYIAQLKIMCNAAVPNNVHKFLSEYPRSRTYTQNIDGLEEKAGMIFSKESTTKGVYLHGNLARLNCQYCGFKQAFTQEECKVFLSQTPFRSTEKIACSSPTNDKIKSDEAKLNQESIPGEILCQLCIEKRRNAINTGVRKRPLGVMHPNIIHYNQNHPDGAFIGNIAARDRDADLLIVMGTSLKVEGIKKLAKSMARYPSIKGKRILVNKTPPTKEWCDVFDYFYHGTAEDFVRAVNYKDTDLGSNLANEDFIALSDDHIEHTIRRLSISLQDECNGIIQKTVSISNDQSIKDLQSMASFKPSVSQIVASIEMAQSSQSSAVSKIGVATSDNISHGSSVIHESSDLEEEPAIVYLTSEIYDDAILKNKDKNLGPEPAIFTKLEMLTESFDRKESISMPILDEALKQSIPTKMCVKPELSLFGSAQQIGSHMKDAHDDSRKTCHSKASDREILDSNFSNLEEEISFIVEEESRRRNSLKMDHIFIPPKISNLPEVPLTKEREYDDDSVLQSSIISVQLRSQNRNTKPAQSTPIKKKSRNKR